MKLEPGKPLSITLTNFMAHEVSIEIEKTAAGFNIRLQPSDARENKKDGKIKPQAGDGSNLVIAAYCEAFKEKYGFNPPITGKNGGQAKALLKNMSVERAESLARAYLQVNDQFFIRRRHPFDLLVTNLNIVAAALDTGKVITAKQAQSVESMDSTARAAMDFLREKRGQNGGDTGDDGGGG